MIYASILAGGKGTRMGRTSMPKQYLSIGEKPIIIHTIEKFLLVDSFEKVIIATPQTWLSHAKNIVKKYIGEDERVVIVEGGADRNESIMATIRYIEENNGLKEEDVIVTHDAVRPFVSMRIIEENIEQALAYGAVDTVIPAVDTIVMSEDHNFIHDIPRRDFMYQGQTPQSFNILKLKNHYESLTPEQKEVLTDACKICLIREDKVALVRGEVYNFKVTTPFDLKVAEAMLGDDEE